MKKITLLGDSIRMGYGKRVEELLKDEFEIYQPEDNCRFSKYTLRGVLYEWSKQIEGSDIIHWNNGLWDMCDFGEGVFTSKEEYANNMTRIAKLLKEKGKRVIFATTTPIREGNPYDDNRRIVDYNNFIVPILSEMGIIINDLHSVVVPDINKYIREDDKIHLTDEGVEICAKKVIETIKSAL